MGGGQISQERLQGEPWRSFRGKINQFDAFSRVFFNVYSSYFGKSILV